MQAETIFRLITLFVLVAAGALGGTFRRRAEREGGAMRSTEGQRLVLFLRLLGLLALAPLFGYLIHPPWVAWARLRLPAGLRWLAAAVALGLLPIFYWILVSIGNNISSTQATRQDHRLVTHGPYRWVRHPLYSFGSLFVLALMVLTGLWWIGVAMIVPVTILLWRTRIEEARLIDTFGDAYRTYMRQTGRFWPRFSRAA